MSQHVSAYNVLQLPTTQNDSPSMEESIVFWIRMSLQVGSFQDPWQHWVCCQALQWSWNGFTQRRANYYIYEHHQCWTCVHISLSLSLSVVLVCLCPPFERAGLIRQSNRICAYTAAWCSILLYVIACWKPRTKTSKQYKGIQRALWILFDSSQFVFHDPVLMIHPGKTLEALQEPLHKNHKSNSRSQSIWLPQQGGHSHMVYTEGYLLIQSKRTRC